MSSPASTASTLTSPHGTAEEEPDSPCRQQILPPEEHTVFSQGMHVLLDWAPGDVWAAIIEKVQSNGMLTIFFPTDSSFIDLDLRRQKRMKIRPASMPTAATTSKSRPPGQKRKRAVASSSNRPRGRPPLGKTWDEDSNGWVSNEDTATHECPGEYKCGKCHLSKKTACLCNPYIACARQQAEEAKMVAEEGLARMKIAFARQQQARKEAEEGLARMKMLEAQRKRKKEKTKKAQQKREEQARKQARKQVAKQARKQVAKQARKVAHHIMHSCPARYVLRW
jgi:hypothetical protein